MTNHHTLGSKYAGRRSRERLAHSVMSSRLDALTARHGSFLCEKPPWAHRQHPQKYRR